MRVITGTARGKRLGQLQGMDTRPTTDQVKESMFNIIQFDVEDSRVLDLFAGTGQLGIEALSRGAKSCVFVDQRRDAVQLIRSNLKLCNLTDKARVVQGESVAMLSTLREQFDLVFLDPPYGTGILEIALKKLAEIDMLSEHGIIICESSVEQVMPELPAPYHKGREYRYGKIKLTVYRKEG